MKLKFIENELSYSVWEDGVDTEKKHYENIGFIPKLHPVLSIDLEYSGMIELDEIEQIYNFMKSMDAESQLNGMERIKCVNCRKEFDSKTEIINDGELKGYKSQNMYCSYTCRDKMNKKINALSIKEVKKDE